MIKQTLFLNHYCRNIELEIENQCPFCGYFNSPKKISDMYVHNDYLKPMVLIFETSCCNKHFLSLYIIENGEAKLIKTYPTGSPDVFPQTIQELSPNFIKLHTQAKTSENNAHFELASTGYRNALEFLVKDFAIKVLNKSVEEVASKSLYKAIEDYLPNENLIKSADVVRILGNDNTHYLRKYPDIDIFTLKTYLQYFVEIINREYNFSNTPFIR